ncbi:hypothetical protein GQ44DRAFT_768386 [Phaeosphaeriaceae sp. PMI808]|nr:hypothetical protein GQ44DRAFT_768386 [Phaeosphaeriaceae sp. PMI808]
MGFFLVAMSFIVGLVASWSDPKDALLNPRGQKVCMQQCGTSALKCPEAFWKEQVDFCYHCCTTWGETVIKIQCDNVAKNVLLPKEQEKKPLVNQEKDQDRELGFS